MSLKCLFPASVARFLMQFEVLRIVECGLEEVVALEDSAEAAARLVFPLVTLLMLKKLPKLKWFSRGVHTSKWPLLKVLELIKCDQIEIFVSKYLKVKETVEQSQLETSIQQPLFLVEEAELRRERVKESDFLFSLFVWWPSPVLCLDTFYTL